MWPSRAPAPVRSRRWCCTSCSGMREDGSSCRWPSWLTVTQTIHLKLSASITACGRSRVSTACALQLLPEDPRLHAEGSPGDYQRALAEGDLEGILGTFEPEGYAREPSGGSYVHRGTEGLRELYAHLFANGGGIPLEHCSLTDDGVRCAIESNC